jgi:hypothetical protein
MRFGMVCAAEEGLAAPDYQQAGHAALSPNSLDLQIPQRGGGAYDRHADLLLSHHCNEVNQLTFGPYSGLLASSYPLGTNKP